MNELAHPLTPFLAYSLIRLPSLFPPSPLIIPARVPRGKIGEGAIDAGGPYRETLSDMVKELHMSHVALLVPCANRKAEQEGFVSGMAGIHNMDK